MPPSVDGSCNLAVTRRRKAAFIQGGIVLSGQISDR